MFLLGFETKLFKMCIVRIGLLCLKICSFYFESECLGIGVESTNILVSMIAMYLIRSNIRLILSNTFLITGNISRTRRCKTSSYFYLKWTGKRNYIGMNQLLMGLFSKLRMIQFFLLNLWIFNTHLKSLKLVLTH